ncbi:MAG: hypothetical protein GY769_15450 [bacterium]|nr:hypothetical protein [bacterium]
MSEPDFLVCLNCETPCYTFEWAEGKLVEILCTVCGNEEPDEFATEDDLDTMGSDPESGH